MEKPAWWHRPWPAASPGKPTDAALANDRKLDTIRKELAWARNCFYYAEDVLPNGEARAKAGRLAMELDRARSAFDTPEKAEGMDLLAHELARVARYDPAKHPRSFVETAGSSVSAAGQAMVGSSYESVAYWGRVLVRAGGFFRAMKYDLSSG